MRKYYFIALLCVYHLQDHVNLKVNVNLIS